jgi:hypothetical protein
MSQFKADNCLPSMHSMTLKIYELNQKNEQEI